MTLSKQQSVKKWRSRLTVTGLAVAVCLLGVAPELVAQNAGADYWVGTWTTASIARAPQPAPAGGGRGQAPQAQPAPAAAQQPAQAQPAAQAAQPPAQGQPAAQAAAGQGRQGGGAPAAPPAPPVNFNNQTIRQIIHTSIGGERVRVTLTNVFGTAPLAIGAAHIALRDKGPAIVARSARALTFGGATAITIPAGAVVVSDPVGLSIPALADVAIDLYLPGDTASGTSPLTIHNVAVQTNFVSPAGNHAGAVDMPVATTTQNWFFLGGVAVVASEQTGAVVTFGDSITDGTRSTPDTNSRWPNVLSRRLAAANVKLGVLNSGIAANRVLSEGTGVNALARFERDALSQPGVTHVVVLEAINDIRNSPTTTVEELIVGHKQLIERARIRGLKIYGATLTPCEGANGCTPEGEVKRQALNRWIRTSKAYDDVIDFDAVVRDPANAAKMLEKYDSGDRLHPGDAGYLAMGNAVDLNLFKAVAVPRPASR